MIRVLLPLVLLLLAPLAPASARPADDAREACRAQARAALGTAPADQPRRSAFVRRCLEQAGARPGGEEVAARRQACTEEMRRTFAPGKAAGGRGQGGVSPEIRQAFMRDCMRRGR
jgi:hypothetical protein